MQTADHFCAGTARWEGACTVNASTSGKVDIPDDFAKKVCVVIGPGIQKCMQQGGGDGSPTKKVKTDQTNDN